ANFARHYRGTNKRLIDREQFLDPHASEAAATPVPADTPTPSVQAIVAEDTQALEEAMQRLPDDYRQVLTLRYLEGHSFQEIASWRGPTNTAVRHLFLRAVEKPQEEVGPA